MNDRPHLVTGKPTTAPYPREHYTSPEGTVWHGDCIETMTLLPADHFTAIVTDPPYGLEFMGREWDTFKPSGTVSARVTEGTDSSHPFRDGSTRIRYGRGDLHAFEDWTREWAEQALRVLRPGGWLLAFGGSRTWHRLQSGIEDAGFEIRDSIAWLYSSGFPKSLDVTTTVEKYLAAGPGGVDSRIRPGVYEVTAYLREARDRAGRRNSEIDALFGTTGMAGHWTTSASQPAVPSVRQWAELKAFLGFDDTMDALVAELGSTERPEDWGGQESGPFLDGLKNDPNATPAGQYGTALKPAFEPIVVARKPLAGTVAQTVTRYGTGALNLGASRVGDEQRENPAAANKPGGASLNMSAAGMPEGVAPRPASGRWPMNVVVDDSIADELGKAAKFFPVFPIHRYQAKAPTRERPAVVDENGNTVMHPTVKPLELMRYLVRLVAPTGGPILEPFAGSGTTVEAAVIEGVECVAIELGAEHLPLIEERLHRRPELAAAALERGEHVRTERHDEAGLLW